MIRERPNAPHLIFEAIAKAFDTDIFSEYEPQFWGYETREEWDVAHAKLNAKLNQKFADEFYGDLMKYLRGEPNVFKSGTNGMIKGKIAKDLVAENDGLLSPDRRQELMDKIDRVYEADHAVIVRLSDEEIAFAELFAAADDDLPQT